MASPPKTETFPHYYHPHPIHCHLPLKEGRKRTGVVSLSFLHGSWAPRSHSDFLVLINKGEVVGAGRGGEGRGGGDKMASSKSRAGEAAELRRARKNQGPAGYAGACPPLSPRSGATSASLLCPWTLALERSNRGGRHFIAKVCLRRPQPAPRAAAGRVRGRPEARSLARCCCALLSRRWPLRAGGS